MAPEQKKTYNRSKVWQIALLTLNNPATNAALVLMGYYAYSTQNAQKYAVGAYEGADCHEKDGGYCDCFLRQSPGCER